VRPGYNRLFVLGVIVTLFVGCGSAPRESFYTLSAGAAAENEAPAAAKGAPSIAVGPVSLPDVVDRPQLVVHLAANRVTILEQQRWAEPLKAAIPRIIAENLSQLLGTSKVSAYPQAPVGEPDYRVHVDIQRFESAPGGPVTVDARWTVRKGTGEPTAGQSLARESAGGDGYEAMVGAYSRALATVSRAIADAIRGN
jgi:uncharacterized lipoprotein YmbA